MTRPVVLLLLAAVSLVAQEPPDFSGRWILTPTKQSGPDIPTSLSIRQSVVRTTVRGEPMTPFLRDLTVDREFEAGTHDTYVITNARGGVVPGLREDGQPTGPHERYAVNWEQGALVYHRSTYTGDAPETGVWTERREVWSLDQDGRLRLTISTRSSADVSRTVSLTYRRP